ncbi:MAG: DUF4145 domain-containing protein [Planctomycetota bacterium]|nr:MAG: DUF4145 domain-containing protein [Planctomycetota bacterium]
MANREQFAQEIACLKLSHLDRAIAFLWFYRQTQEFDERTASELANDLHDEGFPMPRVGRLEEGLKRSRYTISGQRKGSFQIDVRRLPDMEEDYGEYLSIKVVEVSDDVLPNNFVAGTRVYLEKLVHQINGCYDNGFYDACAALCRRLMESLIIEIYIREGRKSEIQSNNVFFYLDKLIKHITADTAITLSRNTPRTMNDVKQLGDTAAHDRTYITDKQDIDDIRAAYRRMIQELLVLAKIRK